MADVKTLNSVKEYEYLNDFFEAYKKIKANPNGYTLNGEMIKDFSSLSEEDLVLTIIENRSRLNFYTANPNNQNLRNSITPAKTLTGKDGTFDALSEMSNNPDLYKNSLATFKNNTNALIKSQSEELAEESVKLVDSRIANKQLKRGIFRSRLGRFVLGAIAIAAAPALLFSAAGIVGGLGALFSIAHLGTLALTAFTGFLGYHFLKGPVKNAMKKMAEKIAANQKLLAGNEKGSNNELAEQLDKVDKLENQLGFSKGKLLSREKTLNAELESGGVQTASNENANNMVNVSTLSNENNKQVNYFASLENNLSDFKKYVTTEEREKALTDVSNAYVEEKINEIFNGTTSTISDVDRENLKKQVADMVLDYAYANLELIKNGNAEEIKKLSGSPISYNYFNNGERVPATFDFNPADLVNKVVKSEHIENTIKETKENIDKFVNINDKDTPEAIESTNALKTISEEDKLAHAKAIVEEKLKTNKDFNKLSNADKNAKIEADAAYIVDLIEKQDNINADEYETLSKKYGTKVIESLNTEIRKQYRQGHHIQRLQERMNDNTDKELGKIAKEAQAKIADNVGDKKQIFDDLVVEKLAKENNLNAEELRKLLFDTEAAKNYVITQVHIVDKEGKNTDKTISLYEITTKLIETYPQVEKQIEEVEESWKVHTAEVKKMYDKTGRDDIISYASSLGKYCDDFSEEKMFELAKKMLTERLKDEAYKDNLTGKEYSGARPAYKKVEDYVKAVNMHDVIKTGEGITTKTLEGIINAIREEDIKNVAIKVENRVRRTSNYSKKSRVNVATERVVNHKKLVRNENGKYEEMTSGYSTKEETKKINATRKYIGLNDWDAASSDPNSGETNNEYIKKSGLANQFIRYAQKPRISEYIDGSASEFDKEGFTDAADLINDSLSDEDGRINARNTRLKSIPRDLLGKLAKIFGKGKKKSSVAPTVTTDEMYESGYDPMSMS